MEPPGALATVCSVCGEALSAKGGCVACLLRGGLDEGAPPPPSLVFGDFEISRRADGSLWELGRGAMGVTYRAVDKVLHRDVALKVIQTPPAADGSRAVRERFLREARAAAALRHPNVAGVFHLSASPEVDHCYFAMELVEGETLEARVRRDGPLKVELALEIAIQVTRALMAAAARGLIHRDLKPGNVMLARGDGGELEVKVIDFGLAKAAAEAVGEMDLTHGGFVGTPAFASPEQFESGVVDVRSDIYALGATLWFALTGRAPFSATTIEEMRVSRSRTPLPVEQLSTRKVPPALITLLRSCLAIDPAERPASARELMEALESCRRSPGEADGNGPRGFFHQLKQRNVVRVSIAYGVTAWLLAQIATQIFPFFEVPNWGVRLVILVLCLGFPVALMLAWAFQITPEGIVRLEDAVPNESRVRRKSHKFTALIVVVAMAAVALFAFRFYRQNAIPAGASIQAPALPAEKSIAVLPLENLSDDKEDAFFADGLQDDILTNVAKISELKVISRTSVSQYRGAGAVRNLREVARELGVENILEGSVRRVGNRVLVNVQLIDARHDRHIWAERYDRTLTDSIGLQGEVATQIAAALRAKLAPEEKARLDAKQTGNPEAYALYLKALGRERAEDRSTEDLIAAEQLYEQAITLDPKFALAHARLSIVNSHHSQGPSDNRALRAKARAAAEEAVRLSPSLGEAHVAIGLCLYWADKDYPAALKEFSIAATTSPNESDILQYIGGVYRRQGRWRESLATYDRAQDLDPRNLDVIIRAAADHLLVRDWAAVTACYNRALEIAPDSAQARIGLAYLEVFRNGNPAAGRKILQKIPAAIDPDGGVTCARWDLAMLERDFSTAEKILTEFPLEDFPHAGDAPKAYHLGRVALARGDIGSAQRYFAAAAPAIEAWVRDDPDDAGRHAQLGLLYAYMGRKEDALREGRRAVELEPESQNAFHGADKAAWLALSYALVGEPDQAITLIERLLSTPGPVGWPDMQQNMTLADLRLRWEWDSLRKDPRFQKILAGPEPETVLTTVEQLAPAAPEKSIAVLPFENLSDDKQNAYFAAGVQDEILSDLAQVADLKVISRTSVMRYQSGAPRNLREIAQSLGVANIVEGSVQRDGPRVRVIAQLIDARTDTHRWSKTYDRDLADIFVIQDEIAQQIAHELQAKVAPQEKALIAEKPTSDLTAYAFYERARALDLTNLKDRERCAVLLEEAVRRDPKFLLAHCRLAEAYVRLYAWQNMESEDERMQSAARAREEIETALRLRPDRGEPHLANAQYFFMTFQTREARRELETVSRLMPNDSEALFLEARLDRLGNRWDEALLKARRAADLDPHNEFFVRWTADTYLVLRRYREGEEFLGDSKMRNPAGAKAFDSELARFKIAEGKLAEALAFSRHPTDESGLEAQFTAAFFAKDYPAALRTIAEAPPYLVEQTFCLKSPESGAEAQVFRARGEREKAQRIFQKLRQSMDEGSANTPRNEWYFANCSDFDAALGRTDEAIREARQAVEMHPIAQDPINGTTMIGHLARAYATAGDRDHAIEQLEMLAKIPSDISYGELRFNPCWDSLRGDSRFEKMVANLAPNKIEK
jgi:TolB-like protein/Tfp pilus assembly protein PilF